MLGSVFRFQVLAVGALPSSRRFGIRWRTRTRRTDDREPLLLCNPGTVSLIHQEQSHTSFAGQ